MKSVQGPAIDEQGARPRAWLPAVAMELRGRRRRRRRGRMRHYLTMFMGASAILAASSAIEAGDAGAGWLGTMLAASSR